jgi:hypothetical protein
MMNLNSNNFTILTCALLFFLSSCKKSFLEVIPKGQRIAEKTADYNLLMNSPVFYQYLSGGGWQAPVLMGDEIGVEQDDFNFSQPLIQRFFKWDAVIYEQVTDVAQDLRLFLPNVYTCNLIINEVMNSSGGTEQEKKALLAEATATRAWLYFQLVNFYAKPYNPETAATDPGFPVITRADAVENFFTRGTVQASYDFIVNDLITAIPNLPLGQQVSTRMTKAAAEAILGKVYLFMGKPELALPMLNAAFNDNAASSAPARLYNYNVTLGAGGSFLPVSTQTGPASPGNIYNDFTESVLAKTFGNGYAYGNNGVVITPETAGLYDAADFRLKFYTSDKVNGTVIQGGRLRKYGISYSKFGVALSEMYLLRAESKARLNDLSGAKDDLETLRMNRIAPAQAAIPANVAADRMLLIRFIFDERIREFAAEGYRWFDMRRQSVDPLFPGVTFTHSIYPASGQAIKYTLKLPERLVLKLPPNIMAANPSFQNNP